MIGTYGNRWANIAMMESDFILVLGSRLDVRQTGSSTDILSKRKIFHIDCENGQLNNRVKGCNTLQADLQQSIDFLVRHLKKIFKKTGMTEFLIIGSVMLIRVSCQM